MAYDAGGRKINGYLRAAKPKGKRPAVIVIHENRGLNPHIEDVARPLALEGFVAFAPDLLSPLGGTPADEDKARDMIGTPSRQGRHRRGAAAVPFMQKHRRNRPARSARSASAGAAAWSIAWPAGSPDLEAAVAYYGAQPPADQVPAIQAPLLLHYAELDERINAGIPAYEAALKANNKTLHALRLSRTSTTPSTTTPAPRATTRRRPSWPGAAPSPSSSRSWARRRRRDPDDPAKAGGHAARGALTCALQQRRTGWRTS